MYGSSVSSWRFSHPCHQHVVPWPPKVCAVDDMRSSRGMGAGLGSLHFPSSHFSSNLTTQEKKCSPCNKAHKKGGKSVKENPNSWVCILECCSPGRRASVRRGWVAMCLALRKHAGGESNRKPARGARCGRMSLEELWNDEPTRGFSFFLLSWPGKAANQKQL